MNKEISDLYDFIDFFSIKIAKNEYRRQGNTETIMLPEFIANEEQFEQLFVQRYLFDGDEVDPTFFTKDLIEEAKIKIDAVNTSLRHKSKKNFFIASKFVKWAEALTPETMPKLPNEPLVPTWIVESIHRRYNTIIFHPITLQKLSQVINNPAKHFDDASFKCRHKSKMTGLISRLQELVKNEDWLNNMLKLTAIDFEFYRRKHTAESKAIEID